MQNSSPFRRQPLSLCLAVLLVGAAASFADDASPAKFYRGLNLNGAPVVIDGQSWEGKDAADYECDDRAFEKQDVPLIPPTDGDRTRMIRSSRWGGNKLTLTNVPPGSYSVLLYVWEDNNSETYSVSLNGREVQSGYSSGEAGHWDRLGPWPVNVTDGAIRLTSAGGAANFSGIEIWRGEYSGNLPTLTADGVEFFEKRIRPILVQHCYECHSEGSQEVQGELLVDSRAAMHRGGSTGPAVVPGDVKQSLLIKAIRHEDGMEMPPETRLADDQIADLTRWVEMGAPDPRSTATKIKKRELDLTAARKFWSLQPIADPTPPTVNDSDWPTSDLDRFILAELERNELKPLAAADKRTLIRRATFDLHGLPPTPSEIDAFLADDSPEAFSKVVDRLLASSHYGERWGRHWMDLVRYADTAGDNSDFPVPQAYRYRNYIIDAFNNDKPYDQFLREQIAGDLLPYSSDAQRNEQLIATGYLAISRRFGSLVENYPQHLTIEDTIDNLGRTVLGLSISCARCHDHKFDPISNDDYYGLYGIFASTKYPFPGIELEQRPRDFVPLVDQGKPSKQLAYAMVDDKPADARVQLRGEPKKLGDTVPRKFLDVLGGQRLAGDETERSGRLQLAGWLTAADNPLTARVMVNRIWQHHFGAGLVATPSDYGVRGQAPSHPELLDWLASRFIDDGYSLKAMHRRMMLSRTYQLASADDLTDPQYAKAHTLDPDNHLHWRHSRERLDAESLRDALLLISGELDPSPLNEPHPFPSVDKWEYTQHHPFRDSYDSRRRSVYLMTARLNSRPFFTTFDGADRNASTPKRDSSVTTIQSLYLLNDEFVHQQADKFAERLLRDTPDDDQRLERIFALTLGRLPTASERETTAAWFMQLKDRLQAAETPVDQREQQAWSSFVRVLFRSNEFLYVD